MKRMKNNLSWIIYKPIMSEKAIKEAEFNRYSFLVHKRADKKTIKEAMKKYFGVESIRITTSILKGEEKRFVKAGKNFKERDYKKAIVTLREDQKIDIFETSKK